MPQDLRQTVQREYDALLREEKRQRDARTEEAQRRDPEIKDLLDRRALTYTRAYSAALSAGRAPDKAAARREYARLTGLITERLAALGLPADYLEMQYQCPLCKDRGYVGDADRRDCECFVRRMTEEKVRRARLAMAGDNTFENFDEYVFSDEKLPGKNYSQRAYMLRVRKMCIEYCDAFPNTATRNILLIGASGLGKTFMLNCVANRLGDKCRQVCYTTAYRMLEAMRDCALSDDAEAFNLMMESEVLIIDDLGSEPIFRNITIEMLFTLLNERARNRAHTLIATNLDLGELMKRYGERVMSRLADAGSTAVINIEGRDLRMRSGTTAGG